MSKLNTPLAKPFAIGLAPLDMKDLLQIDGDFFSFRAAKKTIYDTLFERTNLAQDYTLETQQAIKELLIENLQNFHADLYRFENDRAVCQQTGEEFSLASDMPLADIALLIPEDLIIMRRHDDGWRLVAASLSFPSSWSLTEKFGRPLEGVHRTVPISETMNLRINRIFDALQPSIPTWRTNWALDCEDKLRQERFENQSATRLDKEASNVFLRTEFQTLHKIEATGDILFTVRIKIRPIETLANDADGRGKLGLLHKQYLAMSDAERDYKGINQNADGLLNWLEAQSRNEDMPHNA